MNSKERRDKNNAYLEKIFAKVKEGVTLSDESGHFEIYNPDMQAITGYSMEEANASPDFTKLIYPNPQDRERALDGIKELSEKGASRETEATIVAKDGSSKHLLVSSSLVLYKDRRMFLSIFRDITKLERLALRDLHTGLYNYRFLEDFIEAEFSRARRQGHHLSVIMLDIDYFKSINDVYGHQFGDLILKQFSAQLKKLVRRYDIVFRFGGEEFVVICPAADRESTAILAKRLLGAINLYNFGDKAKAIKLKLSMSVASYPEDRITKGMDLIELSDKILNKVKERGGNRVFSSLDIKKGHLLSQEEPEESSDVQVLRERLEKLTKRANQSLIESIFAFAKTIELKDHYTGEHVESSVYYAEEVARILALPKDEIERIREASMLHDLGKIGISEKILHKKSKLTKEEFEEIKRHPQIAVDILRPIHSLHDIIPLILHHHERWDGTGYPTGLKGNDIPIGARIIAVADVYQALIADRPYRKRFSKEKAVKIVKEESGTHFDPKVVSAFLKVIQREK